MKKIVIFFAFILVSCKDIAVEPIQEAYFLFKEAQPVNDSELKVIPNKFLGLYMSSDSVCLNFNKHCIYKEYFIKYKITNKVLDSLKLEYNFTPTEII